MASPNVLAVCVLEAIGLPSVGEKSKAQVLVKVKFSGQEFKTRATDLTTSAYWDQRVFFVASRNPITPIEFQLCSSKSSKKILGKSSFDSITVKNLKESFDPNQRDVVYATRWLKLTDQYGTQGNFGEIRVAVGWGHRHKIKGTHRLALWSLLGVVRKLPGENLDVNIDSDVNPEVVSDSDASDAGEEDTLDMMGRDRSDADPEDSEDAQEARQKRQEELEKYEAERARREAYNIKPGDWRVIFKVIEVRELKAEDVQGTSDPVCTVTCSVPQRPPVKQSTSIKKGVKSAVFDESLFLDLQRMDRDLLDATTIKFAVFDADLISRNDLIGSYSFNMLDIYYAQDHQLKHQWIGLIDESNPRDTGIQGYAKVSVSVMGPGDKAMVDEDEDEENASDSAAGKEEIGEVLLPPQVSLQLYFLRVRVYIAEDLPALDHRTLLNQEGLDAFLAVDFAGNPKAKTRVITATRPKGSSDSLRCVFNEELWIPTFSPNIAKAISIALWDRDRGSRNDIVGTLNLDFQDVHSVTTRFPKRGRVPPRWYNIYGAPQSSTGLFGVENSAHNLMNKNPSFASAYRGRVLLELRSTMDPENSTRQETVHRQPLRSIPAALVPKTTSYVVRLLAIAGGEIPKKKKILNVKTKASVSLALSIGNHAISTTHQTPNASSVVWGEFIELSVEFPDELASRWKSASFQAMLKRWEKLKQTIAQLESEIPNSLHNARNFSQGSSEMDQDEGAPAQEHASTATPPNRVERLDSLKREAVASKEWMLRFLADSQVPDIFLYLEDKDKETISFKRFKPEELLLTKMSPTTSWISLQEDKAYNKLDDDDFPGSVLAAIGLGTTQVAQESKSLWDSNSLKELQSPNTKKYTVRVNVYQGSELPSADASSMSDPYAKVKLLGRTLKISKRMKTLDPQWYETVEFKNVTLPPAAFAPQVVVDVFDYDKYDLDDYLGSARCQLASPGAPAYTRQGNPQWCSMFQVSPGDCGDARILLSVDVYPEGNGVPPPPPISSILPKCSRKAKLQLVVLGLRNLEAYHGIGIQDPVVQFHLGEAAKARQLHSTKRSKLPSGSNPNMGELIEIPFEMPDDLIFLPRLHVSVVDSRLGGLVQPVVATSAIDFVSYVPNSPNFVPLSKRGQRVNSSLSINPNIGGIESLPPDELDKEMELNVLNESMVGSKGETIGSQEFLEEPTLLEEDVLLENDVPPTGDEGDKYNGNPSPVSNTSSQTKPIDSSDPDLVGRSEIAFVEWPQHDPLPLPPFMVGRKTLDGELEGVLGPMPFESFDLWRGQMFRKSFLGRKLKPDLRKVGVMKAVIRVLYDDEGPPEPEVGVFRPEILEKIMVPRQVEIRLNVLKGFHFVPMDVGGGKSDPYLKIKLGKTKISDRKNYLNNQTSPEFYKRFTLHTQLPGESQLVVKAMDYDSFNYDDLIGATTIDLEDRWFHERWAEICAEESSEERRRDQLTDEELAKGLLDNDENDGEVNDVEPYIRKPVEIRSLWTKTSQLEQGKLELWCDIMDQATAIKYPPIDVSPPADTSYEMRVIIWKSEDIPAFDLMTQQSDLFVKAQFNGYSDTKWKKTDTHWRCKKGKGSWNYRIKFKDIKLPLSKNKSRLTLQLWDKDITKWSDCIAECVLDLSAHLKSAFLRGEETYQVFDDGARKAMSRSAPPLVQTKESTVQPNAESQGDVELGTTQNVDNPLLASDSTTTPPSNDAEADPKAQVHAKATAAAMATSPDAAPPAAMEEDDPVAETNALLDAYMPTWANDIIGSARPPPNSKALHLTSMIDGIPQDMGKLFVSIELVRSDAAEAHLTNGSGRSEPNRFPTLPEPVGRLNWRLFWNPFYVFRELLGPALCVKFCLCLGGTALVLATIFLFPQISSLVTFFTTSGPAGWGSLIALIVVLTSCCCYCAVSDKIRASHKQRDLRREERLEAELYDAERGKRRPTAAQASQAGHDDDSSCCRRFFCCTCCRSRRSSRRVETASDGDFDSDNEGGEEVYSQGDNTSNGELEMLTL